jgi:hypothetical protein
MSKLMYSQKWVSINDYSLDYFEFLYRYYATCAPSQPVTYYSLDLPNSVYDSTLLQAGSYELTGNLSGMRWKKITMIQAFSFEPVPFTMSADETGPNFKDRISSLWFPTVYELQPSVHDFVVYDWVTSREDEFKDQLPLYEVVNLDKASSGTVSFWKTQLKSTYRKKEDIEKQLSGSYSFVDYEKHIYRTSDAAFLQRMMLKNEKLDINRFFKDRIGLFVETQSN